MPVRRVRGGYRWGNSGKVYPTKAQAERQGRAIFASRYQAGGPTQSDNSELNTIPGLFHNLRQLRHEAEIIRNQSPTPLVQDARELDIQRRKDEREIAIQRRKDARLSGMDAQELAADARREDRTFPFTPAQVTWGLGQLGPGAGIADIFGKDPEPPGAEVPVSGAFSARHMPGIWENIRTGHPVIAALQAAGAAGDVAWAAAPFTAGATVPVAVGLKGISTLGKVSRAERAGIAALLARDDLGFVSPTIEAMILRAPPNLKGDEITKWLRANTGKGVKPKELEFLGVDEFIANNPNATMQEVAEGVAGNKVRVSKEVTRHSDETPVLEFDVTVPETNPLDGSNLWDLQRRKVIDQLEVGEEFIEKELLDHYNQEWRVEVGSFDDIPESMLDEVVEDYSKAQYMNDPYEMVEAVGEGVPSGTFAFGNDDTGYQLFVGGKRVTEVDPPIGVHGGDVPYSRTEAQIQLRQAMDDEGHYLRLEEEEAFYGGTQWKGEVDKSLPGGENYREVVFQWDNAPVEHNIGHFDNPKAIAHALVRDRKLADGSASLHVDELQSDLHTKGSQKGYKLPEKLRTKQVNKIEGVLEGTGLTMKPPEPLRVPSSTAPSGWRIVHRVHPDAAGNAIFVPSARYYDINTGRFSDLSEFPLSEIKGLARELRAGRTSRFGSEKADALVESLGTEKIYELEDLVEPIIDKVKAPNYPFKDDWYEMGIKNLVLDAINEGKDAISVSGSAPIKARYSEKYSKFYEMLYDKKIPSAMKKLANKYGGKFERGRLDLEDTFDPPPASARRLGPEESAARGIVDANIIKITPEMKEKILTEGLPSFAMGGLVNAGIEMPEDFREGGRVRLI